MHSSTTWLAACFPSVSVTRPVNPPPPLQKDTPDPDCLFFSYIIAKGRLYWRSAVVPQMFKNFDAFSLVRSFNFVHMRQQMELISNQTNSCHIFPFSLFKIYRTLDIFLHSRPFKVFCLLHLTPLQFYTLF